MNIKHAGKVPKIETVSYNGKAGHKNEEIHYSKEIGFCFYCSLLLLLCFYLKWMGVQTIRS